MVSAGRWDRAARTESVLVLQLEVDISVPFVSPETLGINFDPVKTGACDD